MGIGGSGMSAVAFLASNEGHEVSDRHFIFFCSLIIQL